MSSIIPPFVNSSPPPIVSSSDKSIDFDEDDFEPIDFHTSIDIPSPLKNLSLPSTPETSSVKSSNDSNKFSKTSTPTVDFQTNFDNCPSSENFDDFSDDFDDFQTATVPETETTINNQEKTYTQLDNLIRLAFGANIEDNQSNTEKIPPLTLNNDEFFANFDDIEESPSLNFVWKGSHSQKAFMSSLHIKEEIIDKDTFPSSLKKPESQKSLLDKSKNSNFINSLIEDFTFQLPHITNEKLNLKINCDNSKTTNLIEISPKKQINNTNTIVWPEPGVVDDCAISEFVNTYCNNNNNNNNNISNDDDEWSDFISHTTPAADSSNVVRWDCNNSGTNETSADDEWGDYISIKSGESMFKQNIRADQNSTQSNYFFLK